MPELRLVRSYHDDPRYITALAESVRAVWRDGGPAERLVISFHGTPKEYLEKGDAYFCYCHKTARLLAAELGLPSERWIVAFQSLFGKEEWLRPYTDQTLERLVENGNKSVDVICPGFAADCLETVDEIDREYRHVFMEAGGENFRYIPALNAGALHIEALAGVCARHFGGWPEGEAAGDNSVQKEELALTSERYAAVSYQKTAG